MTGHAGHDHAHDHGHGHPHAPANFGRAFALGIGLNLVFVAIEAGYGFIANSMALLADAWHNLSYLLGLVIAWIAYGLRSEEHTSELPSLMRLSYAVFCLNKKNTRIRGHDAVRQVTTPITKIQEQRPIRA